MNKIAYCSSWANGVCVEAAQSALFQQSSLESLQRLLRRIDHVVLGANAWKLFEERQVDLSRNTVVLLSSSATSAPAANVQLASSPAEAIALLPASSESNLLIAGGLSTLDIFMVQGLIDELIIDIEPVLSTAPGRLFPSLPRQTSLELVGMQKVGAATIQLHYRILR